MGSTRTLVPLLRPWIRRFAMIISAWWLWTSSKFMWEEFKGQPENSENGQLLSGCGFVQRITPPSISRERRIKMHQSIINHQPFARTSWMTPLVTAIYECRQPDKNVQTTTIHRNKKLYLVAQVGYIQTLSQNLPVLLVSITLYFIKNGLSATNAFSFDLAVVE